MAKIAVYLPGSISEDMVRLAVAKYKHIEPLYITQLRNEELLEHASKAISEGCEFFIARGMQAVMLEQLNIPVLPLRITAQELGVLLKKIKQDIPERPLKIGLIGFANMFCDVSHFNELFEIEIQQYLLTSIDQMSGVLQKAKDAGVDAVIGGRHCNHTALSMGMRSYFAAGGAEGLIATLDMAEKMCELADIKRQDSAESEAMVQNNFNGILQIDRNSVVTRANNVMRNILGMDQSEILGHNIKELLPDFSQKSIDNAVMNGQETFSIMFRLHDIVYAVNLSPVKVASEITGAFLTFQEGRRIRQMNTEIRTEMVKRGYTTHRSFADFHWKSNNMAEVVQTAKKAAPFAAPVMIIGEKGVEKTVLAQCIHSASVYKDNGFVSVECSAWPQDELDELIFGSLDQKVNGQQPCLAELAQDGTLFLNDVECLSKESQYKLRMLLEGERVYRGSIMKTEGEIRVICATSANVINLVENGSFSDQLYYELSAVKLEIKPLRERQEDIAGWVSYWMNLWQKKYDRYVHLSKGAESAMEKYAWPGNLQQVSNVCQKIVLLSEKHEADELFVNQQLEQSYPVLLKLHDQKIVVFQDKKAVEINELLHQYQGNREKVAEALGVSKTTLWRYMKKFGISEN